MEKQEFTSGDVEDPFFQEYWDRTMGKKDDLTDGIQELLDGAKELKELKAFDDGIIEYTDGTKEAEDGSNELLDGIQELKDETDDMIDDIFSEDAQNLMTFVKAGDNARIQAASGDQELYRSVGTIAGAILLVQGTRKVPVQYAKRIIGNKQYGGARQYIPLKVNAANVMPIIFAQAIMFIPISIVGFSSTGEQSGFVAAFMDNTGFWYNFVFAVLIILFTYFYTAITINPTQMSDDLKRNNGFIPGVKPGKSTKDYLDTIMDRITLPGAFFLAVVAIMPAFARIAGVSMEFSQFFGGTSLLILVGVVLDTLQQVESHLLMRHYDGLLKSGRIKGRSGAVGAY